MDYHLYISTYCYVLEDGWQFVVNCLKQLWTPAWSFFKHRLYSTICVLAWLLAWHGDGCIWQLSLNSDQHFWMPEFWRFFTHHKISWAYDSFVKLCAILSCVAQGWSDIVVNGSVNVSPSHMGHLIWVHAGNPEELSVIQINGHLLSNLTPYLQTPYLSFCLHHMHHNGFSIWTSSTSSIMYNFT